MRYLFTSESVAEGHPDKIADQVSDALLDAFLEQDENSRVAIECLTKTGFITIAGEVTSKGIVDIESVVRKTIREIGYNGNQYGFDGNTCAVLISLSKQSPDIAQGVNAGENKEQGAGDQGCIKKGTLVRTKRGFIPIEKVEVGDYVSTPYGWKRVLESRPMGEKRIIEISFNNGMSLECTPDHKIFCFDKNGENYWRSASELDEQDFVCILKPQNNYSDVLVKSNVEKSQFFTKYNHRVYGQEELIVDEDIGYLQGEIIGDGTATKPNYLEIAFGNNLGHAQSVLALANRRMPNQWRLIEKDNNINLKIYSVLIRKHFENFGIPFAKAYRKITPNSIFQSPQSVAKSYLRGLFDSDGTIVENTGRRENNIKIRLGSSSKKLLQETQLLLNDMGIKSNIIFNTAAGTKVGKKGKNNKIYYSNYDSYVLSINGFDSYQKFCKEIGFGDAKKQERAERYLEENPLKPSNSRGIFLIPHPTKNEMIDEKRLNQNYPFSLVAFNNIMDRGETVEVYDLEIEDVNMFSANGIFVHNSMFGYATNETPEYMPLAITLAHQLMKKRSEIRKSGEMPYLGPDAKCQVTVEYENNKPLRVHTIVFSTQHDTFISYENLKEDVVEKIIKPVCDKWLDDDTIYHINPTGKFVIGGPVGDAGLTGRKIIVDSYGGYARSGGGAFSGKDASKVDRSAAYVARYVAKNVVASGLAEQCEVQIAYAIGIAEPVSVNVNCFGTNKIPENDIERLVRKHFPLKPAEIIKHLDLKRPIYKNTAVYGHFGRNEPGFTWERLDKVEVLKEAIEEMAILQSQ